MSRLIHTKNSEPWLRLAAMLGYGNGLGASDLQALEPRHIADGWLILPRVKSGSFRRSRLFPESLALLQALNMPPIRTPAGLPLVSVRRRSGHRATRTDLLARAWRDHCQRCGVEYLSFYACRRTLGVIGSESGDVGAVEAVLGHVAGGVGAEHYGVAVSEGRLRALAEHLRQRVLPDDYGGEVLRRVR
jgi:integrase